MNPILLIEIVAPSVEERPLHQLEATLLEACTSVLARGKCLSELPKDDHDQVVSVGVVTWKGAHQAHIDVGSEQLPSEKTWSSRSLEFSAHDPEAERWRAAGFAAAALASEVEPRFADQSTNPATAGTPENEAPDSRAQGDAQLEKSDASPGISREDKTAPPSPPHFYWLQSSFSAASAIPLDGHAPRLGGSIAGLLGTSRVPVELVLSARYLRTRLSDNLTAHWAEADAGGAFDLTPKNWLFTARLETSLALRHVRLNTPSEEAFAWTVGARAGGSLRWPKNSFLAFEVRAGLSSWWNSLRWEDEDSGLSGKFGPWETQVTTGISMRFSTMAD